MKEQMSEIKSIKALVSALPEVAAWPEMVALSEWAEDKPHPSWNLPVLSCRAVGGEASAAVTGAAAMACLQISIILVDDMLDEDPRGEHHRRGVGPTANLALALEAAAFRVIEQAAVPAEQRVAIAASLASMALTTCLGQHWDTQNLQGEENYWRVVRAKSTPFYGAALQVGALLGNASPEIARGLYDLGVLIGELVQIRDDLFDAFQTPANPDWTQGRNNLTILYARTADHAQRERFVSLLAHVEDAQALREAQRILIRCGAVSYCAYHLVKRHQQAQQLLEGLPLADPTPMVDLVARQIQPAVTLLKSRGVDLSL